MPLLSLLAIPTQEDLDALFSGSTPPQTAAISNKRKHKRSGQRNLDPHDPKTQQQHPKQQLPPLAIDPAAQLALRMATPVEGRRLFFVSHDSADVIRQAMVLERCVARSTDRECVLMH